MFEINIDSIESYVWVVCALFLFSFIAQLFYYLYYQGAILWQRKKIERNRIDFLTEKPGVSIIICAQNESDFIRNYLPSILNQKYPKFQVVVVNIGSTDETNDELNYLSLYYSQLYSTFIPMDAQVISPRKLALTVGVKAAKYDILLFTGTDCEPVSDNWLTEMACNFVDKKDFVLGYSSVKAKDGFVNKLMAYDNFFGSLEYMGFAMRGKPYMCTAKNVAYRKKFFFDRKGFASLLHLRAGDSELLINKDATHANTQVAIATDSVVISNAIDSFDTWRLQKERMHKIAQQYTGSGKFLKYSEYVTRALFYASFAATCVLCPILFVLIAIFMFLLRYTAQILIMNFSGKQLNEQRYYLIILLSDIILPFLSGYIFLQEKLHRSKNYVS